MAMNYIFGKSGSGKTELCVNELLKLKDPNSLIYIVPEQFSLQSEKMLVNKSINKALMKIQVLSFKRLAYHVFSETGSGNKPTLDDVGKSMLLRKIAIDLKDKLSFFSSATDKQGFIQLLSNWVTEFYQYGLDLETMKKIGDSLESNQSLRYKIKDLSQIIERYIDYQSNNYMSDDETLDILINKIESSELLRDSMIFIDGFTGFTYQEFMVIEKLLVISKSVTITLNLENDSKISNNDCFYGLNKTVNKLNSIAENNSVEIKSKIWLEENKRHECMELGFLQNYYLNKSLKKYENITSNIKLVECDNIYDEMEVIAEKIIALTREKGYKFNEIAVLVGRLKNYEKSLPLIFKKYDIPVFIDANSNISSHQSVELFCSSLNIICERWSYESIVKFLRIGMTDISVDEVDLLENYILAYGIKGIKWNKEWEYGFTSSYEVFDKESINAVRKKVVDCLYPLSERFDNKGRYKVIEICEVMFKFLENLNISEKLNLIVQKFASNGELQRSKEYIQVWSKIIQVVNKLVEILGDEELTLFEYLKVIEAGFSSIDMGTIPPTLDQVIVGDLTRTRLPEVKALFIIGANEGDLPSKIIEEDILSIEDRNYLENNFNVEFAPYGTKKTAEENFLIYNSLLRPSEYLCVSRYRGGLDGKSTQPAGLINKIKTIFNFEDEKDNLPISRVSAYEKLISDLKEIKDGSTLTEIDMDIFNYYYNNEKYRRGLDRVLNIMFSTTKDLILKTETLKTIYNKYIYSSISRLENYIKCPFSYFTKYNLKAMERKYYEVQSINLGNLFHDVLDDFAKTIEDECINWREVDENNIHGILEGIIDKSFDKETNEIFKNSGQYKYFAKRAKDIAMKSINAVINQMKKGNFDFKYSEAEFSNKEGSHFDAIEIKLENGSVMFLEGRIDRVDTLKLHEAEYVKVIDYKSGAKVFSFPEIYYGLQLQLIVYLDAFIKSYSNKFEIAKVAPAAVLYFRIDNPMLNFDKVSNNDDLKEIMEKQYKMSGIVIDDKEVIKNIDSSFEKKSNIIPVGVKTSGTEAKKTFEERAFTSDSSVVSQENFKSIMEFAINKAKKTGENILTGDVTARPYKYGDFTNCSYCSYKHICGFDPILDMDNYNVLEKIKPIDALDKILGGDENG